MPRKSGPAKPVPANFDKLLSQTDNKDPDIVEQALSKVMQALKGSAGGKDAVPPQLPSPDQTVAIVDGVVKCLAHDNPRVRGAAVLCIAPLAVAAPNTDALVPLASGLCSRLLLGEEARETANLGLRGLLGDEGLGNPTTAVAVVECIAPRLVEAIGSVDPSAVLAHLQTLLSKFGPACAAHFARARDDLFALLATSAGDPALMFGTCACCGALAAACPGEFVADMVGAAVARLEAGAAPFGFVVARIASSCPRKVSPVVATLMPRLVSLLHVEEEAGSDDDDGGGGGDAGQQLLLVGSLSAVSALAQHCVKRFRGQAFTAAALEKSSELLAVGVGEGDLFEFSDEDEDEDEDDGAASEEEDSDTDDDLGEDEEDFSWKVRAEAARCVAALALVPGQGTGSPLGGAAEAEAAGGAEESTGPPRHRAVVVRSLTARIAAESSVTAKAAIFSACEVLLRRPPQPPGVAAAAPVADEGVTDFFKVVASSEFMQRSPARAAALASLQLLDVHSPGCLAHALASTPEICQGVCKVLSSTSGELKASCLGLLRDMHKSSDVGDKPVAALGCELSSSVGACLGDSEVRVRNEAFTSVAVLAPGMDAAALAQVLAAITALLTEAAGGSGGSATTVTAAIRAADRVLCTSGASPAAAECLKQMVASLGSGSQTLVLAAMRTLASVAASPLVHTGEVAGPAMVQLRTLLGAAGTTQTVRRAAIETLAALAGAAASSGGAALSSAGEDAAVLGAIAPLIGGHDLSSSASALRTAALLLSANAKLAEQVHALLWDGAYSVLRSSGLNDSARQCMADFCVALVAANYSKFGFDQIHEACMADVRGKVISATTSESEVSRHALKSFAFCIGATAAVAPPKVRKKAVATLVAVLLERHNVNKNDGTWTCEAEAVSTVVFALRSLGEIGAKVDLSEMPKLQPALLTTLQKQTNGEICAAVIDAFSGVCLGNAAAFMPCVAETIEQSSDIKSKSRMLQVLRELTLTAPSCVNRARFLPILFGHTSSPSQEVRLAVSQCLGNLATEAGAIAEFEAKLSSEDDATKQTAISAAQSALRADVEFDLAPFLQLVGDADLGVREESVLLLDAALRHRPAAIAPLVPGLWAAVCESARFCSNLVQVVDLGGMKHLVDRGLGVRKAAFEALEALASEAGRWGGAIADFVEGHAEAFLEAVGLGLTRCAVKEVTLYFRVGQGQDSEVSQAGGAPHESFVAGRTAEVAAALGVEPSLIEAMDVKKSGKSQFKSAGVVEFCFIIRVADPSALIASLEAQLQGGGGGICASSSVPVQLRDEAARDGGIKVMERPLDTSAIEQVALIVLARIAEAMPDEVLPHIPTLVKLLASMIATSVVKSDTWLAEKQQALDKKLTDKKLSPTQYAIDKSSMVHEARMQLKRFAAVRMLSGLGDSDELCPELEAASAEWAAGPLAQTFRSATLESLAQRGDEGGAAAAAAAASK